jgi:hypothetical protein
MTLTNQDATIILPIPGKFFRSIVTPHPKRRTDYLPAFSTFVNSPSRIDRVVDMGAHSFTLLANVVTSLVYSTDEFHAFWEKDGHNAQLLHLRMFDDALVDNTDLKTLGNELVHALSTNTDYFRVATLSITSSKEHGHANMCAFGYTTTTRTLACHLFEPHAKAGDQVAHRLKLLERFMKRGVRKLKRGLVDWGKWLLGFGGVRVRASFPQSGTGLQTNSPICVQWSLIMFLMYMLNCELHGTCDDKQNTVAVEFLWKERKTVVPIWLFFIESVLSVTFFPETRQAQKGLLNNLPVPHYKQTAPPSKTGPYLIDTHTHTDSAVDFADCSERRMGDCLHPCARDALGHCFNLVLFGPKYRGRTSSVVPL